MRCNLGCVPPTGFRSSFQTCVRTRAILWATLSLVFCSAAAHAGTPAVTLSPASLTFGTQLRNTTSPPQTVTLTNTGTASLSVTSIRTGADFSQTNNCPSSVTAGATCTINVSFTPAANGTYTSSLAVTDNATGSPQTVSLSGTGTVVSLSPASVIFPSEIVGTSSPVQVLTLSNVGLNAVHTSAVTIQGANAVDFSQTNNCAAIQAGGSCAINVTFTPAATGIFTGTVNVTFTASVSPLPATLTGTGLNRSTPVPYLNQPLTPMTVVAGGSGSTLTLNGAGFVSGSSALWNGSRRATTFLSSTQLQATLQSTDVATAGTAQVVVTNPSPGGGTSSPQSFQITSPTSTVLMGRADLAAGTDPRGVIVADFNGDGKPDLAVVDRGSSSVAILLGNGDGTFTAAVNYSTGVDPISIAVGDFNGDGKLDLVTANRASYTISILSGNGDGTFGNHVDYAAGTEPMAIAVGDFNRDGFLDVAETNNADNTVSIFLGVGDGTFQPGVIFPVGAGPIAIVAGDFNQDGYMDLAVADSGSDNVGILLGNGDGTFKTVSFYPTGSEPDGLLAADLNGDGKLDLVTANNGSDNISVLLNSGGGNFSSNVVYPVGILPFAVSALGIAILS